MVFFFKITKNKKKHNQSVAEFSYFRPVSSLGYEIAVADFDSGSRCTGTGTTANTNVCCCVETVEKGCIAYPAERIGFGTCIRSDNLDFIYPVPTGTRPDIRYVSRISISK